MNHELTEYKRRPQVFFQTAWDLFQDDDRDVFKYQKALDAFIQAGTTHNVRLSGCMVEKKYALSYMMDDVRSRVNSCPK